MSQTRLTQGFGGGKINGTSKSALGLPRDVGSSSGRWVSRDVGSLSGRRLLRLAYGRYPGLVVRQLAHGSTVSSPVRHTVTTWSLSHQAPDLVCVPSMSRQDTLRKKAKSSAKVLRALLHQMYKSSIKKQP
ncbi:hypothetical protein PoB_002127100 [Plakobranchus ocellatus]|uniref:Uncharacterized protein n=1 Tax=Plakobranchus ocellatus TaxID=259542 RepID=A0AAV3ZJI1_9GAST|nr:hypothetical protein PoB_002127100 [Plakobranchus ocellatus]